MANRQTAVRLPVPTAECPEELPSQWADAIEVACRPGFPRWREQVAHTGGCACPIHLIGGSRLILGDTAEILHNYSTGDEPGERMLIPCGNRRASRCPSCAETYRADTYQLIKVGLVGGKGVPATVGDHPRVFATFTAPSFGPVHHRVLGPDGKARRCHPHRQPGCRRRHQENDPELGQPLEPETYDYVGAVIWNAMAPQLWARTTLLIRREVARLAGIGGRGLQSTALLSFAKVAEYQARGLVHFHAVIRLDAIDQESSELTAPSDWATVELLEEAIRGATPRAVVESPDCEATGGVRLVRWGNQLDIRPIGAFGDSEELSDDAVAGYIGKYATKGADCTGTIDSPIYCRQCKGSGRLRSAVACQCDSCGGTGSNQSVDALNVPDHVRRIIQTCWRLGGVPQLAELRLRSWAHMLGFRGHFSTKSRRYSVTLGSLRNARRDWRTGRTLAAFGLEQGVRVLRVSAHDPPIDDLGQGTVLVLGHWRYAGRGHSPGEAAFAAAIARDLADNRRIARQVAHEEQLCEGAA